MGVTEGAAAGGISGAAVPVRSLLEFGAVPDGQSLLTEAIQQGLDVVSAAGGGVLYVPPGDYRTGTFHLRDRTTLYLEAGATLWASRKRRDYDATGCLVYADGAVDAAIRGRGIIDGEGESFWRRGFYESTPGGPEVWLRSGWRPSKMMRLIGCRNLLIEGVTIQNSPTWTLHLMQCEGVNIRGISILNGIYEDDGPNTDGIVPDGCRKVRISDCYIQTGDDSIVLKADPGYDEPAECHDITVTNCVLISEETALKIGSGTYGSFRNITFANCTIRDGGCGIGLWMRHGGLIDGWRVENITMTLTGGGTPIFMWSWKDPADRPLGTVRNVTISGITAEADGAMFIDGVREQPLENITIADAYIKMRGGHFPRWGAKEFHADPVPHPLTVWGHRRCPYDIFCRYVDGLTLRNVELEWARPEDPAWGSAIRCRHVRNLELDGLRGRQALGSRRPAVDLRDVDGAFIHNCLAPHGTGIFVGVDAATRGVTLLQNDLRRAYRSVGGDRGAAARVWREANRPAAADRA